MPRAGALSLFYCQDMCLHLSMSFSALSVFKWVPGKMWPFLRSQSASTEQWRGAGGLH